MSESNAEPEVSTADLVAQAFSTSEPVVDSTPPVESAPVEATAPVSTGSNGHPAWQEILSEIPAVLHDKVRPTLEKWDKGVTERLGQVHSQYEPYKAFVEGGITAEQLEAANRLYHALDSDPEGFYKQLQEHYKFGVSGQGQQSEAEPELDLGEYSNTPEDLSQNPLFKAQAEQLAAMQAQFNADKEAKEQAEADAWLDTRQTQITAELAEKKIEPDWDYILNKAAMEASTTNNYDAALTNATVAYTALVMKQRTPVANTLAPPVMTPNGSVPASQFDPNALADTERRQLLAQMLEQQFKQ